MKFHSQKTRTHTHTHKTHARTHAHIHTHTQEKWEKTFTFRPQHQKWQVAEGCKNPKIENGGRLKELPPSDESIALHTCLAISTLCNPPWCNRGRLWRHHNAKLIAALGGLLKLSTHPDQIRLTEWLKSAVCEDRKLHFDIYHFRYKIYSPGLCYQLKVPYPAHFLYFSSWTLLDQPCTINYSSNTVVLQKTALALSFQLGFSFGFIC